MRAIDCPACGQHAEAENDEALFSVAREHANQAHADMNMTDEQVREIIKRDAREK